MANRLAGLQPQARPTQGASRSSLLARQIRGQEQERFRQEPNVYVRPQASPVDTYAAPPRPISAEETEAFQIARALSGLESNLGGLFETLNRQAMRDAQAQAEAEVNQMTPEQVKEAISEGRMSLWESPHRRNAMQLLLGRRVGLDRMRDRMAAYMAHPDPASLNLEEFLQEGLAEDYNLSSDPRFLQGYNEAIQGPLNRLRSDHQEVLATEEAEAAFNLAYDSWKTFLASELENGRSPAEAVAALFDGRGPYSDQLGITYREQSEILMNLAEHFASEGEPELVEKLLTLPLSPDSGPLSSVRRFQSRARDAINTSNRVYNERTRHMHATTIDEWYRLAAEGRLDDEAIARIEEAYGEGEGWLPEGTRNALLRTNLNQQQQAGLRQQFQALYDAREQEVDDIVLMAAIEGRVGMLDPSQLNGTLEGAPSGMRQWGETTQAGLEQRAVNLFNQYLNENYPIDRENPDPIAMQIRTSREIEFYANNDIENPRWRSLFETGYTALPVDPDTDMVPDRTREAAELYLQLYEAAPGYVGNLVPANAQRMYEAYRTFRHSGQMSSEAAIQAASQTRFNERELSTSDREITLTVNGLIEGGWFTDSAHNEAYVRSFIKPLATSLFNTGMMTEAEAITEATRAFEDQHVLLNGVYIPINDRSLPEDFVFQAVAYLQHAYEQAEASGNLEGYDVRSWEDLYMIPTGRGSNQRWSVYIRDPGGFNTTLDGFTNVPVRSFREVFEAYDEDRRNALMQQIEASQARYRGLYDSGAFIGRGMPRPPAQPHNPHQPPGEIRRGMPSDFDPSRLY